MSAPSPSPSQSPDVVGSTLHGMWNGVTTAASHNPWLVVIVVVLIAVSVVRSARVAIHNGPRDAVRTFSRADKALLLARAGHRCEHHSRIADRRCRATLRLEADHVHPWSRGGSTHLGNGQILCKAHNQAKRAGIPWNRSLRRMAANRAGYYPADVDPSVVRKARPAA